MMKCDACEMVSIQGVPCHEHGCPNARKTWVEGRGFVKMAECWECGCEVEAGEACDCRDYDHDQDDAEAVAWERENVPGFQPLA